MEIFEVRTLEIANWAMFGITTLAAVGLVAVGKVIIDGAAEFLARLPMLVKAWNVAGNKKAATDAWK